jgi:ABC-type dipeptide/oligopeptide/nickel transport system permease subunit
MIKKLRRLSLLGALGLLVLLTLISVALGPAPPTEPLSAFELMLRGTRSVVVQTLGVSLVALCLGLVLGVVAGGGPPLADAFLARAVELGQALPSVVILALVLAAYPAHPALGFVLVLGALRGLELARLVRGEVLRISEEQFVLAARAVGVSSGRLLRHHVLPHALGPVVVSLSFGAAGVVALQAALGVLGLAATHGWGSLMGQAVRGRDAAATAWPALAVVLMTGSLYLLAEALADRESRFRRGKLPEAWQKIRFVPK